MTIGGRNNNQNVPVIGDTVFIESGAKILEDVDVENGSVFGANAVVINNVPENCSVGGEK